MCKFHQIIIIFYYICCSNFCFPVSPEAVRVCVCDFEYGTALKRKWFIGQSRTSEWSLKPNSLRYKFVSQHFLALGLLLTFPRVRQAKPSSSLHWFIFYRVCKLFSSAFSVFAPRYPRQRWPCVWNCISFLVDLSFQQIDFNFSLAWRTSPNFDDTRDSVDLFHVSVAFKRKSFARCAVPMLPMDTNGIQLIHFCRTALPLIAPTTNFVHWFRASSNVRLFVRGNFRFNLVLSILNERF